MSNVTVQEALIAAIELIQCFEAKLTNSQTAHGLPSEKVKRKLRDVISEIEKCEPVINLNILKYTEHGVIPDDFKGQASGYRAGWNDCLSSIQYMFSQPIEKCEPVGYLCESPDKVARIFVDKPLAIHSHTNTPLFTSPQPIEKCEPVAEAIRERDRLGFAVVNVIGKLDEIIENTQEVEIDDFLHIAVPIDMWNELQAALEDMPKRADIYTSPQPKEWVEG